MLDDDLLRQLRSLPEEEQARVLARLPEQAQEALLKEVGGTTKPRPRDLIEVAQRVGQPLNVTPHIQLLNDKIVEALRDVAENGAHRRIIVQMPPRSGKTLLCTQLAAAYALSRRPEWTVGAISYDGLMATSWGLNVRRWVTTGELGIDLASDSKAAGTWQTDQGGGMVSRSWREPLTGLGVAALFIDDTSKDMADASSAMIKRQQWEWWQSVAITRLDPRGSLVMVTSTRWAADDLIGRILDPEYGSDPDEWEVISIPAFATSENDPIGRKLGEPLQSPLLKEETLEQATERLERVKRNVGSYVFSALYQQSPSPSDGTIFDPSWFKYWTDDKRYESSTVRYVSPEELANGVWVDSWDMTFKGGTTSDYTVAQRWCKIGANRFLVEQGRAKLDFVQTLAQMVRWADPESLGGTGKYVHKRLVEDKANGPAIITTLRDKVSGIVPVTPRGTKEERARSVTPEIEAGNVYLPYRKEWLGDFLEEARAFGNSANHDDQIDGMTQALVALRNTDMQVTIALPGKRKGAIASGRPAQQMPPLGLPLPR